jgi:tetratricopeptide (TPR) repeat protein
MICAYLESEEKAIADLEEVLKQYQDNNDTSMSSYCVVILNLAEFYTSYGQCDDAERWLRESLRVTTENRWARLMAATKICLSDTLTMQNRLDEAKTYLTEASDYFDARNDVEGILKGKTRWAQWFVYAGDPTKGIALYKEAGIAFWEEQVWSTVRSCLIGILETLFRTQDFPLLAKYLGIFKSFEQSLGVDMYTYYKTSYNKQWEACQEQLGDQAMVFWEEGHHVPFEQIPKVAFGGVIERK